MNHREEAPRSAWTESAANLVRPRFWLTGIAFLAAYLALNVITVRYQFESLGITLWSPDDGLTVLLLIEGAEFFPFVLAGEVLADVLVSHVQHSFYVTVLAEFCLVSRLCWHRGRVARCAQVQPEAERSGRRPRDAGGACRPARILNSLIYCGVLYLAGSLPADQFISALRHFWIGDAVGIIAVIAAATAVFSVSSKTRWVWRKDDTLNWSVFIISSCLVFAFIHGAPSAYAYHLFYLLFLPTIWIGMRAGYVGVAIALLATQTAFFMTASHIGFQRRRF